MIETVATSDDGRRRIVIEHEDWADMPDGDAYGYVMRREWIGGRYVWTCESAPYGDTGGPALAARMTQARNYDAGDGDDAETRAMMRAGAVDWHDFRANDQSGDEWRVVVTRDHLAMWGLSEDDADNPARESAHDWQSWLDGDVYFAALEELATWTTNTIGGARTRDEWEIVDSIGGVYGTEWAERVALEQYGSELETAAAHVNYPHWPGRLYDCPACESSCHCAAGFAECVFVGPHNGTAAAS